MTEFEIHHSDALLTLRELKGAGFGAICDPFAGSGSTIEAALMEGYSAVGIEQEAHNVEIMRKRLQGVQVSAFEAAPQGEQIDI